MTQDNTGGEAWMREQARIAVCNIIGGTDYYDDDILCEIISDAIRAIPLPTDADLLAGAMKLPQVDIARVNQLERAVVASAMVGQIIGFLGDDDARIAAFRTACGPELLSKARTAIAPFTAVKETP